MGAMWQRRRGSVLVRRWVSRCRSPSRLTPIAMRNQPFRSDELRTFSEVYSRVRMTTWSRSATKLIEQAIGGMVSSLDPHSTFLDESAFRTCDDTTGKFGGIGIEIGTEDGFIKVISPIDEKPAARAGIRAGDLITKVDGETTRGLTTTKAVDMMRGSPGTKVKLEVFRKDERATQYLRTGARADQDSGCQGRWLSRASRSSVFVRSMKLPWPMSPGC